MRALPARPAARAADACGECGPCRTSKLAHGPQPHLPDLPQREAKNCEPFTADWREALLSEPFLDAEIWRERMEGENKQLRMGVDIAQEINRKLSLKAYQGGWKVLQIWLPELMDAAAANKLLKVLEEPERSAFRRGPRR
jgi:DNA polymerase-3 subunit delta'